MSDVGLAGLISVAQAIDIIDRTPVTPRVQRVALAASLGRRLAGDLLADRDAPPFRKSLMDGFAVRCADVKKTPVDLQIIGEIAAGATGEQLQVEPGQAVAIMTGAPVPSGADGIVPVEQTGRLAPNIVRVTSAVAAPQRLIAERASDCAAGQVVLQRATLLEAPQIAVAASVGAHQVDVFARPRVAVLGTGNELTPIDAAPGPSQIRNSNTPMLVALLSKLGCDVTDLGVVIDEPAAIRSALQRGAGHDALFVTGGMSMGAYDYVPKLLLELQYELRVTKLRIKPGKPFVFAVAREPGQALAPFVFGLPGNPVSAYVCTRRLASRLLARLSGGAPVERWLTGRLEAGLAANGPRELYQPAIRTIPAGDHSAQAQFAQVRPLPWKGSADIYTLAQANALLVRAENEPAIPVGSIIRVLEL